MCRLFGAISQGEVDADYLLEGASQSLLFQSRVKGKQAQGDGWGVGWFERGRPKIFKSPKPIFREKQALHRVSERVCGATFVGHVRWASNPLKLKRAELIGPEHTQPFAHKNWVFAHNGTLLIPNEVRAALGPLARQIKGNNDSEVLFYWLMKYEAYRSPANIRRAIRGLDALWKTCRKKYPLYKYAYHGLNWILTNGKVLIAMCYVNPGGFGKARALCRRGEPYYQLRYKQDASGWVVASEPLDHDSAWKPLRHGEILITDGRRGKMTCY